MYLSRVLPAALMTAAALSATTSHASLSSFMTFNGMVAASTDGAGGAVPTISASTEANSTVLAAYLYTATVNQEGVLPTTVTLDGNAITYDTIFDNELAPSTPGFFLSAARADVTSIVAPAIDGGPGGVVSFAYNEGGDGGFVDGSALVVVYENASLPEATVAILDGGSDVDGDSFRASFAEPLDPNAAGFFAEMALGIGFSCCNPNSNQSSDVTVNGTLITESAGGNDDSPGNGLLTMGGFDDPFSALLPSYAEDNERYDLSDYIGVGDTSILVETLNPSQDDNIFLAVFELNGEADVVVPGPGEVPLPAPALLLLTGIAGMAGLRRLRRNA